MAQRLWNYGKRYHASEHGIDQNPFLGMGLTRVDARSQQWTMEQAPGMGFLYEHGDAECLARGLQRWLDDPAALDAARAAARHAAGTVFSWEKESAKLVALLEKAMAS